MISISCKKLGGDTQTTHQGSYNIWIGAIIFFMILWLGAVWVNFSWAEVSYDDKNGSFKTVSLEECLQIAKEYSKELQNSTDEFNIAKLKVEDVKADYWPKVSVAADYEILHNKQTDKISPEEVKPYMELSQDIYNTSSQKFSKKWMSMIDLVTAELEIEKTKRNIYLSVAKKYYDLLLAQKYLKFEASMLEQSRRDLKKAESKYKDGLVSEFEVIQSKTNMGRSDLNYRAKQNALEYANMALVTTLGVPRDTSMSAVDVGFPKPYSIDWNQCQKLAIKYNPELTIQRKALEQIPKYQKLAKRIAWPTLTMKAFVGEGSPEADDKFNDDMGVTFTISKTIFDSGITRRKIKTTEIKIKKEESLIRMYEQQYFNNLRLQLNKFINSKDEMFSFKKQSELVKKLSNFSHRSYELGVISYSELLKSQDLAKKTEYDYARAIAKYMMAEFTLKVTMGLDPIEADANQVGQWGLDLEPKLTPGIDQDDKERDY